MNILMDAMGGDHAPEAVVEGAVLARDAGHHITLIGDEARLRALLGDRGGAEISVVHASEVVDMHDKPSTAVRVKKDSSMAVGLRMLKNGEGDAFVSAGSTGALLTGATLVAGRIRGIRRAALAPLLPQATGGQMLLLDSGANPECTSEQLVQFAWLGHFFMRDQQGIASPRIGLLNNGSEESKGDTLRQETCALLEETRAAGRLNFVGNIEAREALAGACDVLVCDGFSGNVLLKGIEGTAGFMMAELKGIFMKSPVTKLAALMVKPGLRALKHRMDYKEVGGAPFLGVAHPVIKAHGSSDAKAFAAAIRQAGAFASCGFIDSVTACMAELNEKA